MRGLRVRAARGVLVNGAFLVGLNFLNLVKGFVAAGLLTADAYGIWGILSITLIAMLWLKDMGVSDKFVEQDAADQEQAFQEAFSVNLVLTGGLFVFMVAGMPLLAFVYGREELVAPGIVLALLLPGLALQAPIWAHYRELRFVRQRMLQSIDPVLSFVMTIGLAVEGAGYWSFVLSTVAGTWLTAIVALRSSPCCTGTRSWWRRASCSPSCSPGSRSRRRSGRTGARCGSCASARCSRSTRCCRSS